MIVRTDHVAGLALIVLGAGVLALGADLPFGTPASPGPGMLPGLTVGLLLLLAVVLLFGAKQSPPLATLAWDDLPHAARVMLAACAAALLYAPLGFILTIFLLLLVLILVVERMPLPASIAISIGVTAGTYLLLGTLLKTPLPRGLLDLLPGM